MELDETSRLQVRERAKHHLMARQPARAREACDEALRLAPASRNSYKVLRLRAAAATLEHDHASALRALRCQFVRAVAGPHKGRPARRIRT